jgi:hypothetical protein
MFATEFQYTANSAGEQARPSVTERIVSLGMEVQKLMLGPLRLILVSLERDSSCEVRAFRLQRAKADGYGNKVSEFRPFAKCVLVRRLVQLGIHASS